MSEFFEIGKDKAFEGKEDYLQTQCMGWLRIQYRKINAFHVPNGGNRNAREGRKFKNMGVVAGVSDVIILEARQGYHGLIVELKNKKGRLRDTQKDFLRKCELSGYKTAVVYSFDGFRELITNYFHEEINKNKG